MDTFRWREIEQTAAICYKTDKKKIIWYFQKKESAILSYQF
jgi:hypothetical protein